MDEVVLLDKDLGHCDRVLLGEAHDGGITHAHSASERSISLDGDVVLSAGGPDVGLGVEGVNLDLVDDRWDARVRSNQLLDLADVNG